MSTRPRFSTTYYEPTQTRTPWIFRILIAVLLVGMTILAAAYGYSWLTDTPSTEPTPSNPLPTEQAAVIDESAESPLPPEPADEQLGTPDGAIVYAEQGQGLGAPDSTTMPPAQWGMLGEADGAVPDATSVFDDGVPGVANLNHALLAAIRQAASDAKNDGINFFVESGWRTPAYQDWLRRDAVYTYGSEEEAARWVASAELSAHVSGDAIDIGSYDAMSWLAQYGAAYGLCQIYSNEPWHYELRPDARTYGCPLMYADPTQDPRLNP